MTTILAVYTSDGCVGRCDASCYQAKRPKCTCICGGANHGKGKEQAVENAHDGVGMARDDLYNFVRDNDKLRKHWGRFAVIDRLAHPNSRKARRLAYDQINQLELFPP